MSGLPPADPSLPPSPPPGRGRRLRWLIAPAAALIIGLAAGFGLTGLPSRGTPLAGHTEQPTREESRPAEHGPKAPGNDRRRLDELILVGRGEEAYRLCRQLAESAHGNPDDPLRYRLGLCAAAVGRWQEAIDTLAPLAQRQELSKTVVAARLVQARCLIRSGRPGEARRILAGLTLSSGHPACADPKSLGEHYYLLAEVARLQATPDQPAGPSEPAPSQLPASVDHLLTWADASPAPAPGPDEPPAASLTVSRSAQSPALVRVTARLSESPAQELLRALCAESGLRLRPSPAARQRLEGHRVALDVRDLPLADVLTALTRPSRVAWRIAANELRLTSSEAVEGVASEWGWDQAASAWRRALAVAPDHPARLAAWVGLGNWEYRHCRFREAASWYDRVLQERPDGEATVAAAYNLGLARFRRGEFAAAREALTQVIDRDPEGRWAVRAWWWIGRSYLDRGESHLALRPFRRAFTAAGNDFRAPAALGLAAAQALDGDAAAARATLRRARRHLAAAPYRPVAAFLDAFVRLDLPGDRGQGGSPSDTGPVEAVLGVGSDLLIGPAGVYLLGQAYRRLGLTGRMVTLYEGAVPSCQGALAVRMSADLAGALFESGRWDESRPYFVAVAAVDAHALGALARLRLAEIAYGQGQFEECRTICREALARPGVDRNLVLALMGRAYERQGDPLRAARCYAGQGPDG